MKTRTGKLTTVRNGKRFTRDRLARRIAVGLLPTEMISVTRQTRIYRRWLEDEYQRNHDEIDPQTAHVIDLASTCEQSAGVCRWLLRERLDAMAPADILAVLKEMRTARQARNVAVKELRLQTRRDDDILATLYSGPEGPDEVDESDGAVDE